MIADIVFNKPYKFSLSVLDIPIEYGCWQQSQPTIAGEGLTRTHILDENPKSDFPPLIPPWKGWKLRANPILSLAKGEGWGMFRGPAA